LIDCVVWCDV